MTSELSTFGNRLDWVRTSCGITYRELDRIAKAGQGVSFNLIRRGGSMVPFVTVISFAESLGIDPMWLGAGRGKEPNIRTIWRKIGPLLSASVSASSTGEQT